MATVYNVEVEDYHTYFVGCQEWGFSVWAHNVDCGDVWRAIGGTGEIPEAARPALQKVVEAVERGAGKNEVRDLLKQIPGGPASNTKALPVAEDLLSRRATPTTTGPAATGPAATGPALPPEFTMTRGKAHFKPELIAEDMRGWQLRDHGHPRDWVYQGTKTEPATGRGFRQGDRKVYEVYTDTKGNQIEYHYHILRDGQITETKVRFPGTTNLRD